MSDRIMQAVRDWTIRRKIITGFIAVLLITGALGWFAIRRLQAMYDTVNAVAPGAAAGSLEGLYRDSRLWIFVLLAAAVLVGVALALFVARLIADPLTQLGIAAEEV